MTVPLYQAKAEFFRALGHPARIRILELLAEEEQAVYELLEQIQIEPSNLSQQLAVLRLSGLISQRRDGSVVIYSLALPEVEQLLRAARAIITARAGDDVVDEVSRPRDETDGVAANGDDAISEPDGTHGAGA